MSHESKLIWLGEPPTPPAEPRFFSRFQWRYKRFKPFAVPVRRINRDTHASKETRELMRAIIETLPPFPLKVMAQYGVAMLPVHDLWDDIWYILGWGARGYDRTDGYDYVGGICAKDGHLAVVAERVKIRDRGWMKQENLVGIMWHELGHSFDHALAAYLGLDVDCFSESPAFRQAWLEDSSALKGSYRAQFAYFLQPDGGGESEAFAECFAVNGEHSCIDSNIKNFPIYFPRCLALVKAAVENHFDRAIAMLEAHVNSSLISDQPSSKGESHV